MNGRPQVLAFRTDADVERASARVLDHLRAGKVIAYPTETVYGLGGLPSDAAVRALLKLKGRDPGKTFLLLVSGTEMLDKLDLAWNDAAASLARQFWPGPLTLVLTLRGGSLPDALIGANGGVAVRWTPHANMARILRELGSPITSTSANATGLPAATSADQVSEEFAAALSEETLLLLDGGVLPPSLPSTVIDCTRELPRIVRQGAISPSELHPIVPM